MERSEGGSVGFVGCELSPSSIPRTKLMPCSRRLVVGRVGDGALGWWFGPGWRMDVWYTYEKSVSSLFAPASVAKLTISQLTTHGSYGIYLRWRRIGGMGDLVGGWVSRVLVGDG